MTIRVLRFCLRGAALAVGISALPMFAQPAGSVRVTDPSVLAAAGFAADSVVYMAPGASIVQRLGVEPKATDAFGSGLSYQGIAGNAFHGRESTYAYTSPGGQGDVAYASGDIFADALLDVPGGARWDGARYWASDSDAAQDLSFFLLSSCLPAEGAGSPTTTILASGSTTGSGGNVSDFIAIPSPPTIDNAACVYWFRTQFNAVGHTLYKARIQWARQVSPAPVTASFLDVPTDNPFFQYVEALKASGITGGCGDGTNFCPDQPVLRKQMATFLAKALGLYFPN